MFKFLIDLISGEWLLKKHDNGGAIIIQRTLFCSICLFLLSIGITNLIDPTKSWIFSLDVLRKNIVDHYPWFGAIFAAVYAALYARFSAQWSYLANLYNTIKQSTLNNDIDEDVLAEWKAAFIEDAEYLHLAHKENFASIIHAWGKDKKVKDKYIRYTPGGKIRFDTLMSEIDKRYSDIDNSHLRANK